MEPDPWTDKGIVRDHEKLDALGPGDVWIGMTRPAFKEYLRVHGWSVSRRTLDRRVASPKYDRAHTSNGTAFYFARRITPEVREQISRARLDGRTAKEAVLFAFRSRTGRSAIWWLLPRSEVADRNDAAEFTRFLNEILYEFPDGFLDS